jgi:hypothetical protein
VVDMESQAGGILGIATASDNVSHAAATGRTAPSVGGTTPVGVTVPLRAGMKGMAIPHSTGHGTGMSRSTQSVVATGALG